MFLLRGIKAYLCPNIINFDAVDFSEPRPEEVMFLLMLSVYQFMLFAYNQRFGGSIPLGAYATRESSLSTNVSLDPGVVDGYPARIHALKNCSLLGCGAKAEVMIIQEPS